MNPYEKKVVQELKVWQNKMAKHPSLMHHITKKLQNKTNSFIPQKIHLFITESIKNMVKGVLIGSKFMTRRPLLHSPLEKREYLVKEKLDFYRKAAAASGAGTGSGGILLGLADFPLLLSLKMKFLFDVASLYGFDVRDYKERVYILYIFLFAFSSQEKRNEVYAQILDWDHYAQETSMDIDSFDWKGFQQEYRDYIDLAKLFQLLPGVGAIVGAYANYQLMDQLGEVAMNAYRLRLFSHQR